MNNQQEKTLLPSELRDLKKMAHHLKPVVQIGKKGLSKTIFSEIDAALEAHELIKIQLTSEQKKMLDESLGLILRETKSQHIDTIGNVVILYRRRKNS
jgi:RNA-binding protein